MGPVRAKSVYTQIINTQIVQTDFYKHAHPHYSSVLQSVNEDGRTNKFSVPDLKGSVHPKIFTLPNVVPNL